MMPIGILRYLSKVFIQTPKNLSIFDVFASKLYLITGSQDMTHSHDVFLSTHFCLTHLILCGVGLPVFFHF
jgi:hypothetical protein